MEVGVHLPRIDLMGEGLSSLRMFEVVDAARDGGFVAVSANDHFVFPVPWLDGLTALAAVVDRSGDMKLATTLSLPSLRGPVPLAEALAALDVLSEGRVIAGLGPGSSGGDYRALGISFNERWARFAGSWLGCCLVGRNDDLPGLHGVELAGERYDRPALDAARFSRIRGTVASIGTRLLPHVNEGVFAIPTGVALVGLGYSLWCEQRDSVRSLRPTSVSSVLGPTGGS